MKEKNKKTLREGLDRLPTYDPPAGDWETLQHRLKVEQSLQTAIRQLPTYDPPERVWAAIEAGLATRRLRIRWRSWASVAAAIALLVIGYQWWEAAEGSGAAALAKLHYSTEIVDDQLLAQVPDDADEAYFERLLGLCQEQPIGCRRPDVRALQAELAELTEARTELRAAIGAYGTEPTLLRQLKDIELDRTRIAQALLNAVV